MSAKSTRFITRQEIIKEIGEAAYREAVAAKKFRVYKFAKAPNAEHNVRIKEFEAFLETCVMEIK